MLNKLDYTYNSESSIIHKMNPTVKLIGLMIYVLFCFLKFNNLVFIINISIIFSMMLFSNINFKRFLKVLWNLKFIIMIMYFYMYSKEYSFIDMNTIVFEFVFFIFYLKLIVFTTTKDEYGKGSSVLVNIFNLIGLSTRRIANWFSNIPAFFQCFFDSIREVFISSDNKGRYYTHSNIANKVYLFFFYFKNIFSLTKEKMKLRKEEKKYKLYNKKRKSNYQYRYKLKLADYIFVIIYIGLMIFYILKVR